jgi:gas vesicle protein
MKSTRTIKTKTSNMNNNGKLIAALLAGAAVGAILGVLFAPDSGSATRKKIMDSTDDLADSIKDKIDALTGMVSDKYSGNGHTEPGSYQSSKKGQNI